MEAGLSGLSVGADDRLEEALNGLAREAWGQVEGQRREMLRCFLRHVRGRKRSATEDEARRLVEAGLAWRPPRSALTLPVPQYARGMLLEGGVHLTNFHTWKACAPSRGAIMSGRYPFHFGFYKALLYSILLLFID